MNHDQHQAKDQNTEKRLKSKISKDLGTNNQNTVNIQINQSPKLFSLIKTKINTKQMNI